MLCTGTTINTPVPGQYQCVSYIRDVEGLPGSELNEVNGDARGTLHYDVYEQRNTMT